jgi:aminoglycoside phosphotransferase family enzyme/predicted kinase
VNSPEARQADAIALLAHELGGSPRRIDTHISHLLLGQERVFKVKRAVRTPYLDYSTVALRVAACRREVELNRRTAPSLYRGVVLVSRDESGKLRIGGDGELVEVAVEMERFPDDALLDRAVQEGRAGPREIEALAAALARFHGQATVDGTRGGAAGMARVLDINEAGLAAAGLVDTALADEVAGFFRSALSGHAEALDRRRREGRVRHCHGDLTLRNIALIDGQPTPFDCIEFDDDLATIDVLYDLAFPLMDLWHRDRRDLANRLFNRWCDATGDTRDLALLPFFMAVRAAVRAHVMGRQALDHGAEQSGIGAEALAYLELAVGLLQPAPARCVAVGGLSGSGKSTVAAALAPDFGLAPGARVLASDRTRKRLFGVDPTTRLPPEAYEPEVSARVYAELMQGGAAVLAQGHAAVLDAVFDREADRAEAAAVAQRAGVPFAGLWLDTAARTRERRVAARSGDVSDATVEVVAAQSARELGSMSWTIVPADGSPEEVVAAARSVLGL